MQHFCHAMYLADVRKMYPEAAKIVRVPRGYIAFDYHSEFKLWESKQPKKKPNSFDLALEAI